MTLRNRIPYWVKLLYLAWLVFLLPSYWVFHGPQNLLWLCDAANIILLFALWRESALLMSSQACGVVHLSEKGQEAPARPLLAPPTRAPPATLSLFAGKETLFSQFSQRGRH